MKKVLISAFILIVAGFGFSRVALADDASPVTQVFQNAKDALDSLVTAKDEGSVDDVALRINAFKQVLDLSTAEVKDFESKLFQVPKNPDYDAWVSSSTDQLKQDLSYFDSERQLITGTSSLDLAGIKTVAEDFKTWRDADYLPLTSQVQDFLLVQQEFSAINTSQKRLTNITKDLSSLTFKTKDRQTISDMLDAAKEDIKEANDLNGEAYNLFLERYVSPLTATSSTSTEVTPGSDSTSSATGTAALEASSTVTSTTTSDSSSATSTATTSSSTDSGAAGGSSQVVSIKDLVNSSLAKVKGAYQNFIDISNFVRKLLQ